MSLDPAALAAWRQTKGRVGTRELPEALPGAPFTLTVDFGGLLELMQRGEKANPLIGPALDAMQQAAGQLTRLQAQAETTEAPPGLSQAQAETTEAPPGLSQAQWTAVRAQDQYVDAVLAAFIVAPVYCRLADLPPGGCPVDAICFHDIPPEVRGPLVDLAVGGYDALDTFRARLAESAAVALSGGVLQAAPESDALPPGEPPASVLAGRGDLPGGAELGASGSGPPGAPAPAADAPAAARGNLSALAPVGEPRGRRAAPAADGRAARQAGA